MPCSATITARGRPCASQRLSGRRTPSRATIASSATTGMVPPVTTGPKSGAQAASNTKRHTAAARTSHPKTVRRAGAKTLPQHQHADHQNVIDPCGAAKRQHRAFIIEELGARHVQPRPAAIAERIAAGALHLIEHAQADAETRIGFFDLAEALAGEILSKPRHQSFAHPQILI